MLKIHNYKRYTERNDSRFTTYRMSRMKSRIHPPWYLRCWVGMFPRYRLQVSSSQLNYSITIALVFFVLSISLVLLQLITKPDTSTTIKYIPMVEFNRGDVNKQQVLENARRALQKVAEFQQKVNNKSMDSKSIFESLLQEMNKKEKRQFLALEAFNIYEMDDFESLMELGYEMNKKSNATYPPINFTNSHKMIENVTPHYQKLCYNTSFTLTKPKRPLDRNLCDRLKFLEAEIKEGRELPLLTIYTWWPDPITDPEVLSKRAVLANWDLFRPFIVPIVFTNFRMNMAVANAHGWPCLPVEYENGAHRPIFKHTTVAMEKVIKSTFYGYAMANSMFDTSLLQTLLSIKDRYVQESLPTREIDALRSDDRPQEIPLLIYGRPISTAAVGLETFEKMEYFHRHVENSIRKNESIAMSLKPNYVVYRGVDFSDDASVVIDDEYLIPYLVERHMKYRTVIIDASDTILCAKTHRHLDVNEWGRKYIQTAPHDAEYNKRHFDLLRSGNEFSRENTKAKFLTTLYDEKNRVRVMTSNGP